MYVVDVFHMALSLGATILDQVPKSQIPALDHQQEDRRADHKSASTLSLPSYMKGFFGYYILHIFHMCIFADEIQGAFVHQNFISMFVELSVAV